MCSEVVFFFYSHGYELLSSSREDAGEDAAYEEKIRLKHEAFKRKSHALSKQRRADWAKELGVLKAAKDVKKRKLP